jgi:hypothetical protein
MPNKTNWTFLHVASLHVAVIAPGVAVTIISVSGHAAHPLPSRYCRFWDVCLFVNLVIGVGFVRQRVCPPNGLPLAFSSGVQSVAEVEQNFTSALAIFLVVPLVVLCRLILLILPPHDDVLVACAP